MLKQRAFSVLGNIAIVNFLEGYSSIEKKKFAKEIIEKNKAVRTVLEKSGKFKGRLRKQETKWLAGDKTKEVIYRENGCEFRFNIDVTYFSSRLANERKEACQFVRSGDEVLVMFAGVAPFPIVVAKNTKAGRVYSNELNRKANDYAKMNIRRNKLQDRVLLLPGDIKKVALKLKNDGKKFDLIMMTRPNLDETFLDEAFMLSKNGARIYYHGFGRVEEKGEMVEMIRGKAKMAGFNIKVLNIKEIGDIAPGKVRVRIVFEVRKFRPFLAKMQRFLSLV